jgi:hypothetical protein
MSELRRRDVKILIEVMAGAPGSGVEKGAFIADLWGNIFELLELAPDSERSRDRAISSLSVNIAPPNGGAPSNG